MNFPRQILRTLITSILIFIFIDLHSQDNALPGKPHHADPIATHNMLVIGEKTVYLSHLPMFQEKNAPVMPHRYQVLLEVSFGKPEDNSQNKYSEDRRKNPAKIYTLNPENFVLPTLVSTDSLQKRRSFSADIFRGHLEKLMKGEGVILKGADVHVKNVIYFHEFNQNGKKANELEYLLFGKGQELFLAHRIAAPPDFDQILAVKSIDAVFSDEELDKGILLVFPGTTNSAGRRLNTKKKFSGEVRTGDSPVTKKVNIEFSRELYFEEGELRLPPVFNTTAEEKKAGFN